MYNGHAFITNIYNIYNRLAFMMDTRFIMDMNY